jgi:ketosteroid isomerase-like protein
MSAADKDAIIELVRMERFYRDRKDWDALASCYTEDSRVKTTWFSGTGREFAEASRDMAQRGRHSLHLIAPTSIRVNGDRALCESLGEIHSRQEVEGVEADSTMYCRFFSRVRRTPDGWKLASFDGIYGKDEIRPTNASEELPIDWERMRALRPSYRVWAYTIALKGYEIAGDELGDDRPDLLAPFYADAERWLANGP